MNTNMETMICEYEAEIEKLNNRINEIVSTLCELKGSQIQTTYRKIKIYNSMVEDMEWAVYEMKKYLEPNV